MGVNRRNIRSICLSGTAMVGALALMASPAHAQEQRFELDVPPQRLDTALRAFARQSQQQLIYAVGETKGFNAPALNGSYTADEAIGMLVAGTGLEVHRNASGVFLIEAAAPQSGSAAGGGATVEALIVTAQKREEDIQDVPIAISAFTQEDLTRSQIAGGPDLMTQVPNFTFTKTNFSSYSIQIRGIGTQAISATTDAAVAVAMNNTSFIRNRFFEQEFYDLQRVEVLRGPQGTLYGRNATAGVVNIITAKPKFSYEARLSADVANYNSTRLEGMINLPLVEDVVALRLAGAWTKRDGYAFNEITGRPIDGRDLWSTRASLRITPNDALDVNLIYEHFEEDDDRLRSGKQLCHRDAPETLGGYTMPQFIGYGRGGEVAGMTSQGCIPASLYSPDSFEAPNGYALPYYHPLAAAFFPAIDYFDPYASTTQSRDLRVIESTVDPHYSAKTDTVEFQFDFDLSDDLTLTSETAYLADELFSTQDFNRFNTRPGAFGSTFSANMGPPRPDLLREGPNGPEFCDPQIGCSNRIVAVDLSTARSRQFSQELRLSSDYDGPFNFSLGANFLRYDTEDKYYVFINSLSMWAAMEVYNGFSIRATTDRTPWIPGVSDNRECMLNGLRRPDPNAIYNIHGCVYIDPNPIGSLNDLGHNYFLSKNPYKLISYAMFGEAYYNVTPKLKVTAGLRWTVDKKEAPRIPSWLLGAGTAGHPVADVIEQEWREPTGRLTVDWKPDLSFTDETLLYASYSHGYKAGGANPPTNGIVGWSEGESDRVRIAQSAAHPKTFDPEFIDAYELGTKNTLLDGRLTLNAGVFYYDYTGYQISQIVDRSALNLNFDAKVWGAEIEADWRPVENLRLGFKGGYENTRVADGERAIDLMNRTAGHGLDSEDPWIIIRPFPTYPSNCVVPLYVVVHDNGLGLPQRGGGDSLCERAYLLGLDPLTSLPYVPNPTTSSGGTNIQYYYPGYPGYDPTLDVGQNNGEGFYTDLSGNELPNAPHFTATITADYTLPLANSWLMTLHTDLYYQAEAWTRIFNTEGYDKLKAYTNVNLAAIFTNEEAGWKVMAYVKNVMDRDSITGAFLNSDDTGLTTNVFLTEPRLYGLRVTKEFSGGPWWTGVNPDHVGPYPLTVEIGGQIQRQDAPYETLTPSFADAFPAELDPLQAQNRDLDWGDGRELKLTYRPGGAWSVSAGVRYGRTNGGNAQPHWEAQGDKVCGVVEPFASFLCDPNGSKYTSELMKAPTSWADASAANREEHTIADFEVGRDLGLGGLDRSSVTAGLRYAAFTSDTKTHLDTEPDFYLPQGWAQPNHPTHFHRYQAALNAEREFKGEGPTLSWSAAKDFLGDDQSGRLGVDWTARAGILFGKQDTDITGYEESSYWSGRYETNVRVPQTLTRTPVDIHRSKSVSVPLVDLSLGLSYEIQRVKVGAGYRWERYYNVLDAGDTERKQYDRTIDGPYFKIAVGFGG